MFRRLAESGVAVIQGTSPLFARQSFWCIVKTLQSAGFQTTPYHAYVPSFGEWGFIIAGKNPVMLDPVKADATSINRSLKQWKCAAPEARLGKALELAQELGRDCSRIVVLTDQSPPPELASDSFLWVACGRPVPNVGFVNAARSAGESKDRCMLEIANFSERPAQSLLSLEFGAGIPPVNQVLNLSTGELKRLTFDLPPKAGELRACLSDDALAADNKIVLLPQPAKKVTIALDVADQNLRRLIQKAMNASGLALPAGSNPQLVVVDRFARTDNSPGQWTLRIDSGTNALSYTGPFVIDTGHPLATGLDLEGVIWGAGTSSLTAGSAVISAGNIPVVNDQAFPSGRHDIRMHFRLNASTLQNTPNWPIFFWNLLKWRAEEADGLSAINVPAGADVVLRLDQLVPTVTVRRPDGTVMDIKTSRRSVMLDAPISGIYHIAAGEAQYILACNLLSSEESDLRGSCSGRWGQLVNSESLKNDYASYAWPLLLLALGLLIIHLISVRS